MEGKGDIMQMMDKIVIVCSGKVNEAFNEYGKAFDFLWNEDIESTWSYIVNKDENVSIVTIYGFEPVEGTINRFLDKRRKNNFIKQLNDIEVDVIEIEHLVVDSKEYEEIRDKMGIIQ